MICPTCKLHRIRLLEIPVIYRLQETSAPPPPGVTQFVSWPADPGNFILEADTADHGRRKECDIPLEKCFDGFDDG